MEEPERPSSRISHSSESMESISSVRQIEPRKLSSLMKGELDWVVMKAIEKDRKRRYESIAELVADVSHYLANKPVSARPPSLAYRVRSYPRHRPTYLLVATAVVLVVGTAFAFQNYSAQIEFQTTKKNTQVAVDSLQGAERKAVPFALDNLIDLPDGLKIGELKDRVSKATGQQKRSLSYGLARYDQVDIDAMVAGVINEDTDPEEIDA